MKDKGERSGVRGGTVTPPMPSGALSAGSISMRKLFRQAERGKGPYHEGSTGRAREEEGEKEGDAVERSLEKRGGSVGGVLAVWSRAEVVGATGREQHRKRARQEDMRQGMQLLHRRQRGGRVKVLLYMSSYYYVCVLILVYMRPHTST